MKEEEKVDIIAKSIAKEFREKEIDPGTGMKALTHLILIMGALVLDEEEFDGYVEEMKLRYREIRSKKDDILEKVKKKKEK